MQIIDIKNNDKYLDEYIELCSTEWGSPKTKKQMKLYIENKKERIHTEDNVISILGLIERKDLTPWYATMYVKEEYRGLGYSKLLNDAILNKARLLGYNIVYLKTDLENYYEKFGAKFIEMLNSDEKLYYFDLSK